MKKQNIFSRIFGIMALLFLLNSCTDLEPEIFDKLSPENYPQSDGDIAAAVTGIYSIVKNTWAPQYLDNSHMAMNLLPTDELTSAWGGGWGQTDQYLWTENSGNVKTVYFAYLKGISRITLLLDDLKDREFQNEAAKTQSIGELHALRGYFAFQIYDLYGTFPLITDVEILKDVEEQHFTARSSKEEIVKFIEDDFTMAVAGLPANYNSNTNWGRVTKGAAYTMLMKLYLHEKNWQKVNDVTNSIMGLGYTLLDNYADVFDPAFEGFSNTEVIWPIPLIADPGSFSTTWFAAVGPQFPAYQSETGITMNVWGGLKMPWDFYDRYEEGIDARLSGIIRYYTDKDGNYVDYREVQHAKAIGANPKKYGEDPGHKGANQGNDLIRYRYADVLLARAEALNELNGPTSESIDLINQIRRRAKVEEINIGDYNKASLRDFILDERGRELYCEGHRRQDLIRHGKLISVAQNQGFSAALNKHIVFPIPQDAIDENSKIIQNPEY